MDSTDGPAGAVSGSDDGMVRYVITMPMDLRAQLKLIEMRERMSTTALGLRLIRRGLQVDGDIERIIAAGVEALRTEHES